MDGFLEKEGYSDGEEEREEYSGDSDLESSLAGAVDGAEVELETNEEEIEQKANAGY
jgi:hypothetical protein